MKKRFLYNLFLASLLFSNVSGMAQSDFVRGQPPAQTSTVILADNIHDGRTMIMFTPQFLMIDQFRIEIDRRLFDRHWISLAPHYVQKNTEFQTHWGIGLGATYRWFTSPESSTYYGIGFQFTHHNLENSAFDDQSERNLWLYQTKITQYGANAIVGRYIRFFPHIYGDIYGGIGYRLSQTSTSDGIHHAFKNRFFDLAYEGWMVVLGVRIGIML